VQRRELHEPFEPGLELVVDDRRLAQPAAVDDPVCNSLDAARCFERLDRPALVLVDRLELEARRPGVDDEDAQPGQVQSRISGGSSPCSRP
jgi:hypothetical protein